MEVVPTNLSFDLCPLTSCTDQEGGLKSVVEYHQEERKQIQEQLQSLEGRRELIQCDLNNARSKGRTNPGTVGRDGDWKG